MKATCPNSKDHRLIESLEKDLYYCIDCADFWGKAKVLPKSINDSIIESRDKIDPQNIPF